MNPMRVSYRPTEDDTVAGMRYAARTSPVVAESRRANRRRARGMVLLVLVLGATFFGLTARSAADAITQMALFIVAWLVLWLLIKLVWRLVLRIPSDIPSLVERNARRALAKGTLKPDLSTVHAQIEGDSICFANDAGERAIRLASIDTVDVADERVWMLRAGEVVAQVPLRAFATENERREFLRLVCRKPAAPPTSPPPVHVRSVTQT